MTTSTFTSGRTDTTGNGLTMVGPGPNYSVDAGGFVPGGPGGYVTQHYPGALDTTDTSTGADPTQTDAYQALLSMLDQYGLGSLAPKLKEIITQGYTDANAVSYLLQQTPEWQQRFAGNAQRIKNGLAALQPGEYLATEAAYKSVLRNAGLPQGFYDSPADFANFIGNGVSGVELQSRVQSAQQRVNSVDPNVRSAFQQYYGVDSGHLLSYFLDPKKGTDILQQQAAAADIGAAALDQGLGLTDQQRAMQYAQHGISAADAQRAYGTAAAILPDEQRIAERFGQNYTQADAENELLGGMASAQRKRQLLNKQEAAQFSGSGGVGDSFYHPDFGLAQDTSGQF